MRARLAMLVLALAVAAPAIARAELLADVRSRGTLKVGMAEYVPWMMKGPDGKPIGLEVEIAERLAGDIGVQLEVVPMPFDSLIDRLAAREVDLVAANLSITPERALKVAFTEPYSRSEIRPVIRRDKFPDDVTREALNTESVTIGAVAGTTNAATAADQFPLAQITEYATHDEAAKALVAGSIMALIGSTPFPELMVAADPDHLAILGDEPLRTTVEAFAVPQGEQVFLTCLDNWIDAVTAEGFVAASELDWFNAEAMPQPAPAAP
jgi:polar amino acid transport system substrate-binding protein